MCKIFSCLENVIYSFDETPDGKGIFAKKCIDLEKLLIYCELAEFEGKKSWPISPHEMQSVEFSEILHFHAKSSKWVNIYGEPSNNGPKIMVFNLMFTIAIVLFRTQKQRRETNWSYNDVHFASWHKLYMVPNRA